MDSTVINSSNAGQTTADGFTWVPVFKKVAEWISHYEHKQKDLITILRKISEECEFKEANFLDELEDGSTDYLASIDPFTFFSMFMKFGEEKRKRLFAVFLKLVDINVKVPSDFHGVPEAQGTNAWLFPFQKDRDAHMIPKLWILFNQAKIGDIKGELFDEVLRIPGTGFTKLTQCLFYINPEEYFPFDAQTKPWLTKKGIQQTKKGVPQIEESWAGYQNLLLWLKENVEEKPFYKISYEAWEENQESKFSAKRVIDYLKERFPGQKFNQDYIAFRTFNERELAFKLNSKSIHLLLTELPTKQIKLNNEGFEYTEKKTKGLVEVAPTFDNAKLTKIKIISIDELKELCDWYEKLETFKLQESSESPPKLEDNMRSKYPLNQILFGPAGTGKTYHTINHAVAIIDGISKEKIESESRENLKKRFDQLVDAKQIRFVTFHQSFSYEDFVEGIRAETKDDKLIYNVKPGIFKQICDDASEANSQTSVDTRVSIEQAIRSFIEQANKQAITLKTKTGIEFKVLANANEALSAQTSKGTSVPLSPESIKRFLETQSDLITDQKSYEWAIAKHLRSQLENEIISDTKAPKPYVLIIDEINRGNISRIFGELITLIEESKREDESESLSVTLPYSGETFSVPNNVYIIGTMNSSDRSLTGLDLALRRRFAFVEMQSNSALLEQTEVEGLRIGELLRVMNQRIEALLDRDHCIGHAYFMPLKEEGKATLTHLKEIFLQKIIPLLQEYFFDDWAKINLVLFNNGMLKKQLMPVDLFPTANSDDLGYLEQKNAWRLELSTFDNITTYSKILNRQELNEH